MAPSSALLVFLLAATAAAERAPRMKRQADDVCVQPANPPHTKYECTDDAFYLSCDASCEDGYEFQDDSPSPQQVQCDIFGSTWFSGPDVPRCVPICTMPCQNGGTCDAPNHCSCPAGYSGNQCQSRANPCQQPPNPRSGQINCQKQGADVVCTVSCSTGFRFESQAAAAYRCSSSGAWSPAKETIPDCVQDFDTVIPTTQTNGGVATGSTAYPAVGRGAMCVAWGQEHYRTFDNKVYTFTGQCTYTLARDCSLNTFTVNVINDRNCQPGTPCKRELDIYLGSSKVSLRAGASGPEVTWDGTSLTVPTSRSGTVFQQVGRYLTVQSALGFMVKWDGKESVFFRAMEGLKSKTCGLCGVYDGDQSNDLTLDGGGQAANAAAFGTSWKKSNVGEAPCPDSSQQQTCDAATSTRAGSRCAALLSDPAFTACHSAVDVTMYIEACKFDCCKQDTEACTCTSMEAYSKACMDKGVGLHWRRNNRCPVMCSGGKIFQECGSSCTLTCENPKQVCTDTSCVDGCFCPPGTVEHAGHCVAADQCPCTHGGKDYQNGESFQQDCNTCTCESGTLTCTKKTCSKRCSATGDPHYLTFDGHRFDFMGNCSYYLLYDNDFDVIVDNIQCGHTEYATCTKSVTIDINGMNIKMDHNHRLFVNGREISQLPYQQPGLKVFMVSSLFMEADLANGVKILWDGRTRVYVTAPSSLMHHTQGLCGTFDNNQNNDLMTREKIVENNANRFGNSWKTQASCHDVPDVLPPSPCDSNPQRKQEAMNHCNQLKNAVFSACHDVEPIDSYLEDCMYDMCACSENMKDCLCPTLGIYADTCAAKGVKLSWRQQISECMIQCPGGQEYQVCGNPCERTCHNIAEQGECEASCVEGCNCPDGQALNDQGQCVPTVQCPCVFDDREYPAGYATLKGAESCKCVGAQWACSRLMFGDSMTTVLDPLCPKNSIYKECMSQCPGTCDNMGDPSTGTCAQDPAQCKAGCECVDGYVKQGDQCVNRTTCPCHHGGHDYHEGDVIAMDCNQCTCRSRKWMCETNDCPSTCSAVGDSHYKTFDGKEYQFQGTCDYVLTKSQSGADALFQVTTQNVACGSTGVTCSKMIEVTVGEPGTPTYYKLDLVKGQSVKPDAGSPFTVREVGEFVYIDTPFGLSIQWDKGTRVYVRLETQLMNKVEGLCGNFNGNQNDDFKGPSGGPAMVRATEFGDSWKLHDYCAPSTVVSDTCQHVPQRRPWAQKECSILASDLFAACHAVEDHTKYLQRCVYDTCACTQGGDCECLCTAIAAYAHVCANKGYPVKWRSNDLCPLECEDCQTYSACVSPCPKKTCDNRLTYNDQCKDVEHTCFEGCDLRACPPGQVYSKLQDPVTCIPETMCDTPACKINGKTYREGERVYDETVCNNNCEICNCRKGVLEHIRYASCPTLVPTAGPSAGPRVEPNGRPVATPPPLPKQNLAQMKTTVSMSKCRPGETYESCGYMCEEACDPLRHSTPLCEGGGNRCVPGCRNSSSAAMCAPGEKRVDVNTCVPANMCPCLKPDGTAAKPFETWKNPADSCSDCSCQSGAALCTNHDPSCTATPSVTPTAGPGANPNPLCGWSQWLNMDTPTTGSGDVESLTALRSAFRLCDSPISIECRDAITLDSVIDGSSVSCDLRTGLTCHNADKGGKCADYEVRVYCPCAGTVIPVPKVNTTGHTHNACVSQWSDWINRDTPSGDGDKEGLTFEEKTHFCPGGKITDVQCMTVSDIEYFSTGETATCTAQNGMTCLNADNDPAQCSDYKIKYQCTCAPINDENPTVKPQKPAAKCGWTSWMSGHRPSPAGETETLTALRSMPGEFCPPEDIVAVECRPMGNQMVEDEVKAAVTCDLRYDGMVCRSEDLPVGVTCPDYQVRFLCEPRGQDCSGVPTPNTTQPLVRPHPRTHVTAHPQTDYPACRETMNGEVPLELTENQLNASSSTSLYTDATRSSLDTRHDTLHSGGWVARVVDDQQWLEVSFAKPMTISGLVTKGRDASPEWVTQYVLLYSMDGSIYHYYQEEPNLPKVFKANSDSSTEVRQTIQPTTARFFMIKPVAWHGAIAIRLGLLGCQAVVAPTAIPTATPVAKPPLVPTPEIPNICMENMGMMNGQIRDDMLRASSFRDAAHAPQKARLGGSGSWLPARDDANQYLQIDLLTSHFVTGLTTQGRPAAVSFVKKYRVLYSEDGVNWNVYREEKGVDKIFDGNTDSVTPVTNIFKQPIKARFIRLNPRTWEGRIALRFELHGCFESYPPGSATPTAMPQSQPKTTPPTHIPDGCIQWDSWVDTHQPGLLSRDDFEPIETIRAESRACTDPLAIQCRTASSDHTPWELTGQPLRCDLWTGLLCNADDVDGPACYNYQVRLGCLQRTAECLSKIPTAAPTAQPGATPVPVCYPSVDRTSCPASCPAGQYCDGARCVPRSECPCLLDNKVIRARDVTTNGQCETCQCLNGEVRCVPKTCSSCSQGFSQLNRTTCDCACVTCKVDEFQCSTGSCIPQSSKCDGVINCQNDEIDCDNPPKFVPPTAKPTAQPGATPNVHPDHRGKVTPPPQQGCPDQCPVPEDIPCPANVQVVEVLGECNCPKLACLATPIPGTTLSPNKVCRVRNGDGGERTYQIGEVWTEGVCADCACIVGSDGSGEVSCHRQKCPVCKLGEKAVSVPGECCEKCQPDGCVVNTKLYKAGESMPSSRGCYVKTCERDNQGTFVTKETQIRCKPLDLLSPCQDDTQRYDADGCCLKCVPKTLMSNRTESCTPCGAQPLFSTPEDSVAHFTVHNPQGSPCRNTHPLPDLTQCGGQCGSPSSYRDLIGGFQATCSCCQPTSVSQRHVTLTCDDGSGLEHSYTVPDACQCEACADATQSTATSAASTLLQ
ncbi:mucin-5B-like [Littorina saxatilis]|uniref:Uncharacterized protein n=1 Tax=Littorina saxatilis TaxID=31220 RepID=A0AAN9BPT3_9CAEN